MVHATYKNMTPFKCQIKPAEAIAKKQNGIILLKL
jgi:hypothetical protein